MVGKSPLLSRLFEELKPEMFAIIVMATGTRTTDLSSSPRSVILVLQIFFSNYSLDAKKYDN
jgi:hypothetical protein